jgi:hypothetical protein
MRGHPRVFHLARTGLPNRIQRLNIGSEDNWPIHLKDALRILHEAGLSPPQARKLTMSSVSSAYCCAQAISQRARAIAQYKIRIKLHRATTRLAKCLRRAPAGLRRRLDAHMQAALSNDVVDTEIIEEIMYEAATAFMKFPRSEAAQTALRALSVTTSNNERIIGLSRDYSGLDSNSQRKCESALIALASRTQDISGSAVFGALADAISAERPDNARPGVDDLIVRYVADTATLWREVRLRPTRATRSGDPTYKSRFHRFVELVLTGVAEPSSRRHDENIALVARAIRVAHTQLPAELRRLVSPRHRRADVEWLVSEDHIKKALAEATQKIDPDTP